MLSKTPRFGIPYKYPYCDFVGPGAYDYDIDKPLFQQKAPFLKSAKLEPSFFNQSYCESHIYGFQDDMKDRTHGTSPSNKAPRKMYEDTEGPPPTNYTVKLPACPGAFDNKDKKKRLRKYYVCKVPYHIKGTAPSIPTEQYINGYDIDEDNNAIPVPPKDIDRTGGPAKYANLNKTMYDLKYKGTRFTKSERGDCYGINPDAPGPADYDKTNIDSKRDPRTEEIRAMARLMTFLPRFLEKQEMILLKEGFPGPGSYDIAKPICKQWPPIKPMPIVAGAKRFPEEDPATPGPADYDIEPDKYPVSKLNVPFSNATKRFQQEKPACLNGPGGYEIPSEISSRLSKNLYYANHQPPFSKGAKRVTLELSEGPGPADYTAWPEDKNKKNLTSVFNSKTKRWPHKYEIKLDYLNLVKAYECLLDKKSSSVGKIPFNVGSKRKGFFDFNPTPPSTKYTSMTPPSSKGYYLPQAKRFADPKDNFPGPGAYLIHPLYGASLHGAYKTYNLKLKEEALKMAFRCNPKDTWPIWMKERKKKKQMRWFIKEGKEYTHCHKDMKPYKT